jgi:ankyrin repeat protein
MSTRRVSSGSTALHWAARNGHEAVRLLVEHKAEANAKDNNGWMEPDRAAKNEHEAIV